MTQKTKIPTKVSDDEQLKALKQLLAVQDNAEDKAHIQKFIDKRIAELKGNLC